MTCEMVQSKITPFINDQLTARELEEFVLHIKNCQTCKDELAVYYALLTAMKQLDEDSDLSDNYIAELEEKLIYSELLVKRSKWLHRSRKYLFSMLWMILMIITGVTFSTGTKETAQPMAVRTAELAQDWAHFYLGEDLFYQQERDLVKEWKAMKYEEVKQKGAFRYDEEIGAY